MFPLSPEERSLLDAVQNAPDDDGPRLVYADWFDDRGDPRGRFIRLQLALARLSEYEPRRTMLFEEERQLLARHESEWTIPLRGLASGIVFRRGFVDEVNVTARQFLARSETVFESAPIRHLHLLDVGQNLSAVLASPLLSRLSGLSFYAQYLCGVGRLVDAKTLSRLSHLYLGRNRLTDDDVRLLATAPLAESIEELDLHENEITDIGAERLAEKGTFPKLTKLDLSHTGVGPVWATTIATAPHRPVLRSLSLAGNAAVGRSSADGVTLFRVNELNLSETGLTVLSLNRFLGAVDTPTVKVLRLVGNTLGDGGAETIATSSVFSELRELDLRRNEIGSTGLEFLTDSTTLNRLHHLDLTSNPIDPMGWATLLTAKGLKSLRKLELPTAGISSALREALDRKYNRIS